MYLILAMLGSSFQAFSLVVASRNFVAICGLLIEMASLVALGCEGSMIAAHGAQ